MGSEHSSPIRSAIVVLAVLLSTLVVARTATAQGDYVVGAQDVLTVLVWSHAELSGKFNVEADGTVKLPLIDRVKVAGLTPRRIEEAIATQLIQGYLKNPQVSVTVEQYKSQRVFVQGEVRLPGVYTLSGDTTLVEVLTRAGLVTPDAGNELILVRPPEGRPTIGPIGPESTEEGTEIKRIDLFELQNGSMSGNVTLRDGDTIHVPRGEKVYIIGHVMTTGAYTIRRNTTVLQALALAGGVTDRGATNRVKIRRMVDGKAKEIGVELDSIVQPGDTIVVPERYF